MARGVNKVMIVGNLGQNPDVRVTAQGMQVANLSIATDESYKDRTTGERVPKTEWHRIVLFGKTAEVAAQYLKKGSKVFVEGRLQTRKWTDKNNINRYTTEIVVGAGGQMLMLDSHGGSGANVSEEAVSKEGSELNEQAAGKTSTAKNPIADEDAPFDYEALLDDEIPF